MPSENFLPDCIHAVSQVRDVVSLTCLLLFLSRAWNHTDLDKPMFEISSEMFANFLDPLILGWSSGDEHANTRGPDRCILYGRRSRRRCSTASPLHNDALEPLEFFICVSFQPVPKTFVSLLCHLLLKFFRRPKRPAALAQGNSRNPSHSVIVNQELHGTDADVFWFRWGRRCILGM